MLLSNIDSAYCLDMKHCILSPFQILYLHDHILYFFHWIYSLIIDYLNCIYQLQNLARNENVLANKQGITKKLTKTSSVVEGKRAALGDIVNKAGLAQRSTSILNKAKQEPFKRPLVLKKKNEQKE